MRNKNKDVKISRDSFEDFIWTSYRYCIGRHTIAAACHTDTIAKAIKDNPHALTKERIEFMAVDIFREVNQHLNWKDSYQIYGVRDMDIFSAVLYASNEVENPKEWIYEVDAYSGDITTIKPTNPLTCKFDDDYIDLMPWVKLANWLDKSSHKMVTTEFEGKVEIRECFHYPQRYDGEYKQVWSSVEDACMSANRWVAEEFITKIEDIH